jgi:hypothetical protein
VRRREIKESEEEGGERGIKLHTAVHAETKSYISIPASANARLAHVIAVLSAANQTLDMSNVNNFMLTD